MHSPARFAIIEQRIADMKTGLTQKEKHVVWLIIDGCHAETFYNLYAGGNLPHFKRALGEPLIVERALTNYPSVTLVCLSALATGCAFNKTGLLNNVFYDRSWKPFGGRAYLSELPQTLECYDRKKVGLPTILLPDLHRGGLVNNDINPRAKTIYEVLTRARLTSIAVFNYVGRGATVWRRPSRTDMLHYAEIDKRSKDYARFDRLMTKAALNLVRRMGLPNLLSLYFGGNDGNSHHNGVGSQSAYLRGVVDLQMGRLLDALQQQHDTNDIYFIISADHGQTGFPRGGSHKFIWTDRIELMLNDTGPDTIVDGGEKSAIREDANVVYAIGNGACLFVYARNRATNKWTDAPRTEQDVFPIANAMLRAADPDLQKRPSYIGPFLDFIALRTAPDQPYRIYANDPPYDRPGRLTPAEEFFADRQDTHPGGADHLAGLQHPDRGPDILMALDYDRGGYYFSDGPHLGNHGSMSPEDIYIPLVISGPRVRSGTVPTARAIDIAPTIASIFGLDMPSADGTPIAFREEK